MCLLSYIILLVFILSSYRIVFFKLCLKVRYRGKGQDLYMDNNIGCIVVCQVHTSCVLKGLDSVLSVAMWFNRLC